VVFVQQFFCRGWQHLRLQFLWCSWNCAETQCLTPALVVVNQRRLIRDWQEAPIRSIDRVWGKRREHRLGCVRVAKSPFSVAHIRGEGNEQAGLSRRRKVVAVTNDQV